ncbi:FecR family protein [Rhodanobacter sp. MP7CTX1]|uniref:FecR family protein n=1 Tax=Rhodanobacter sp. MP7CTX1 TaxID=2723084 RepID=UPI001608413F|nr:FecR family protein [Rhodanobacter sp. MP7CTX1]MBB6187633.1 ferric-dicitrate binding protein FerR (iron transport regulator) [Rhodanobacter sp. MP7CTX1]
MKRHLCLLVLVCLACLTVLAHADEDHVALVKSITGDVKITRLHDTFGATGGATLRISDRVVTAAGASAAIVFRDGTLLTLGSGSDIQVRDYVFAPKDDKFAFSLYLTKGSAIYESGKIGKLSPQSVKIETPKATVGVRGTRFLIETN